MEKDTENQAGDTPQNEPSVIIQHYDTMGDDGCWRDDLATCNIDEVYCEECRNEIIAHLAEHH